MYTAGMFELFAGLGPACFGAVTSSIAGQRAAGMTLLVWQPSARLWASRFPILLGPSVKPS